MTQLEGFIEHVSILPDPRRERTKEHNLIDIAFIAVAQRSVTDAPWLWRRSAEEKSGTIVSGFC